MPKQETGARPEDEREEKMKLFRDLLQRPPKSFETEKYASDPNGFYKFGEESYKLESSDYDSEVVYLVYKGDTIRHNLEGSGEHKILLNGKLDLDSTVGKKSDSSVIQIVKMVAERGIPEKIGYYALKGTIKPGELYDDSATFIVFSEVAADVLAAARSLSSEYAEMSLEEIGNKELEKRKKEIDNKLKAEREVRQKKRNK